MPRVAVVTEALLGLDPKTRIAVGEFWQREPFDRYIRNQKHIASALRYIEENPVKAGLCARAEDWKWSSAKRSQQGASASQSLLAREISHLRRE